MLLSCCPPHLAASARPRRVGSVAPRVHVRSFHFSDIRTQISLQSRWVLNKICVIQCEASALAGLSGVRAVSFLVPFISLFVCFYITEQYCGVCGFIFNSQICFVLSDTDVHLNVFVMTLTTHLPSFPPLFTFPVSSLSPLTCLTCTFTLTHSLLIPFNPLQPNKISPSLTPPSLVSPVRCLSRTLPPKRRIHGSGGHLC